MYGLEREPISSQIELIGDYPSRLAERLLKGEIDIGLVPVAVLPELKSYHIVSDYCIGAEGEIASVALFSNVPIHEIKKVLLDYQSRTSVALLKYLMQEYWGINPELVDTKNEEYRNQITGTTAGLVIGDRAFEQRKISTFIYDLGSDWRKITGLPFVFAAWVSTKPISQDFIKLFNEANASGLEIIDEIVEKTPFSLFDLSKYYKLHLSYSFNSEKQKGMDLFLKYITERT